MTREVLLMGQKGGSKSVYHDPHESDPRQSKCGCVTPDDNSRLVAVSRLPDKYRYCRYCDDEHEIEMSHEGTKLATKLKRIGEGRPPGGEA